MLSVVLHARRWPLRRVGITGWLMVVLEDRTRQREGAKKIRLESN